MNKIFRFSLVALAVCVVLLVSACKTETRVEGDTATTESTSTVGMDPAATAAVNDAAVAVGGAAAEVGGAAAEAGGAVADSAGTAVDAMTGTPTPLPKPTP